jgi:DeoR family transcriptional regulator, suf operon transcriptional repressor
MWGRIRPGFIGRSIRHYYVIHRLMAKRFYGLCCKLLSDIEITIYTKDVARIDNSDLFTYDCPKMPTPFQLSESTTATLPSGYEGLRGTILLELKKSQGLTAKELATRAGVSLNAVRHHIKELEAERLIAYERLHRGVGAPPFAYRLTTGGHALFPRRYEAALTEVLNQVVELQGRNAAVALLEARYERLTERLQQELRGADSAQKLKAMARLLSDDGYMAEASPAADDGGTLIEHNCAIQAVAERFPEICAAEAKFLAAVLGGEVQREHHILAGCSACEYRVRFKPSDATSRPEETI